VETLRSIQVLRAGAALAVVLYHALQWAGVRAEVWQAGVDVFFVISGFVIWATTAERDVGAGAFLWRRATRIAPLYWLATGVVVVGASLWPALFPMLDWDLRRLLLSLGFVMHLDDRGQPFPVLPVGWSLTYEAWFYLIFAVALLVPRRPRLWLLTVALAGLSCMGFVERPEALRPLDPFLLQFLGGIWIAEAWRARRLPTAGAGFSLALIGLALLWSGEAAQWDVVNWRPFLWGPPAALIVLGLVAMERGMAFPPLAPLERLGDASYALYLFHVPLLSALAVGLELRGGWEIVAVGLPASVALAFAVRVAVEKPLLAALRGERRRQARGAAYA
jgi:exopolysaccharide production protein ExoZ